MDINSLQEFLDNHEIPRIKKKPKTFLGITKQTHYENVLSNIYAFFFDVNEEHGMGDLFLKSLIACISKTGLKDRDFKYFSEFDIETEYYTEGIGLTGKRGYIDLLLYNGENAIIIENKVNHYLNNDLDDYWNSIKLDTESITSKIGVLLSLKPISKDVYKQYKCKDEFINITHYKFMKTVIKNSKDYPIKNNKYNVFLNDLHQNIINISRSTMSEKKISFYINNKQKINQLVSLKYSFKQHIITEVENAGDYIKNVKLIVPRSKSFNAPRLRYYQSTKHSELLYTVVFEDLLNEKSLLHIHIEPTGNALRNGAIFRNIHFDKDKESILRESFYNETSNAWSHFASKSYELEIKGVTDLSKYILDKLKENHFNSVFEKLEKYLLERSQIK